MTLIEILYAHAKKFPNKLAYCSVDRSGVKLSSLTYSELLENSYKLAIQLSVNISKNDIVSLVLPNGTHFIESFFAILHLQAIPYCTYAKPSPLMKSASLRFLENQKTIKPKFRISTEEINSILPPLFDSEKFLNLTEFQNSNIQTELNFSGAQASGAALIQFTSGTINTPKTILLTHEQIVENLYAICTQTHIDSDCRMLTWLPQSHDMGLIGGLLVPFYAGGTCYILDALNFIREPLSWLKLISKYRITISPAPCFAFELCNLAHSKNKELTLDLTSWSVAYNGSEPIDFKIIDTFIKKFSAHGFNEESMYPCYGLAEATLMVSGSKERRKVKTINIKIDSHGNVKLKPNNSNSLQNKYQQVVSSGLPVVKTQVFITNKGQPCHELTIGEISISGPSVIKNINPLESTYNTQDIGFLFENELYVLGRSDDIFIIYGEKYHPFEIENLIKNNFNGYRIFPVVIGAQNNSVKILCEVEPVLLHNYIESEKLKKTILTQISQKYLLKIDIKIVRKGFIERSASGKISRTKNLLKWNEF